jgi:hypothetical protein
MYLREGLQESLVVTRTGLLNLGLATVINCLPSVL